jgi:hypothetical protein
MSRGTDTDRDAEIEEILVDTYSEEEAMASWEVAFQDDIATPFEAGLLGDPVTVMGFRLSRTNAMQCHIRRQERERWIGVEDLDEESLPEDIFHVLGLYRHWRGEG